MEGLIKKLCERIVYLKEEIPSKLKNIILTILQKFCFAIHVLQGGNKHIAIIIFGRVHLGIGHFAMAIEQGTFRHRTYGLGTVEHETFGHKKI